ncbi:hypothetical protein [Lysobacter gummosus]
MLAVACCMISLTRLSISISRLADISAPQWTAGKLLDPGTMAST